MLLNLWKKICPLWTWTCQINRQCISALCGTQLPAHPESLGSSHTPGSVLLRSKLRSSTGSSSSGGLFLAPLQHCNPCRHHTVYSSCRARALKLIAVSGHIRFRKRAPFSEKCYWVSVLSRLGDDSVPVRWRVTYLVSRKYLQFWSVLEVKSIILH